jgi:hypothetical protein
MIKALVNGRFAFRVQNLDQRVLLRLRVDGGSGMPLLDHSEHM